MKLFISVIVLISITGIGWAIISYSDGEYTCGTGMDAFYQRVPSKVIMKVSGNSFQSKIKDGTKLDWHEAKQEENTKVLPNEIQQPELLGKQFLVYGGRAGAGSVCSAKQ